MRASARKFLYVLAVLIVLATATNLFLGVHYFGALLGNQFLLAGVLLLPPSLFICLLAIAAGRAPLAQDALARDETIIAEARIHWGVWLAPLALIVLCLILVFGPVGLSGQVIAAVLYILVLPVLLVRSIDMYMNTELVITQRHLLSIHGLLWRRVKRIKLNEVSAVGLDQSILARILGMGRLAIVCSSGRIIKHAGIADPNRLRSILDPTLPHPHAQQTKSNEKPLTLPQ